MDEAKMIFNVVDGTHIMCSWETHTLGGATQPNQLLTTKTELTVAVYCEMPYVEDENARQLSN